MRSHSWDSRLGWVCLLFLVALGGCQTTGPTAQEPLAPNQVACTVGDGSVANPIVTRVWRGSASSLDAYDSGQVCARLGEVGGSLQEQGARLLFGVTGPIAESPRFDRADNALMRTWPVPSNELHLVIVDAIAQCGSTSGYILGCTPQLGRPVVFVKRHALFQDWAPEWVIWGHEMGHAAGLLHPDHQGQQPTYPTRLMTYMPTPESTQLTVPEPTRLTQLAQTTGMGGNAGAAIGPDSAAAVGAALMTETQARVGAQQTITAAQLIPYILVTGTHGVPIQSLTHLDDNALLTLRVLLTGADALPGALRTQVNALVTIAELGGPQAQEYVRTALGPGGELTGLQLRRYGLWALGRGQQRHPTAATQAFLRQAQSPAFWCGAPAISARDCEQLAKASGQAWQDTGLAKTKPGDAPAPQRQ